MLMTGFVNKLLRSTTADPDRIEPLLAGFATWTAHIDDEELAAALDGTIDPRALGHALSCADCAESLNRVGHLVGLEPFPSGPLSRVEIPNALLVASIRACDGALEILECSGATRVQAALAVRRGRALSAVSLRDRSENAAFEIGLVPEAESARLSLIVRWFESSVALCARAYRAGKLLAETEFEEGSALLANLRTCDLRVDVVRGETVLAVARLQIEAA